MKVNFLRNKKYSPNGWDFKTSEKGDCEDLKDSLAKAFIAQGICEDAEKKPKNEPKPEAKPKKKASKKPKKSS